MGAIFPVLDKEIDGVGVSSVSGRMINLYDPELGVLARDAGLTPLMDFFGADPAEYADLFDEEIEIPEDQLGEKWFAPEDGLRTIRFLLERVRENPAEFENDAEYLASDLADFERVLQKAQEAGAKWHVEIEI